MRKNVTVHIQLSGLSTALDAPSTHPIGMGVAFYGMAAFFVILFLLIVWVGNVRDRRRGGPRPAPTFPILGHPEDGPPVKKKKIKK